MNEKITKQEKTLIIESITSGLLDTSEKYNDYNKSYDNAKHFVKMDEINNSICDNIKRSKFSSNYSILTLMRGGYKVFLLYRISSGELLSFMSKNRFNKLILRENHEKIHYLDALSSLNNKLDIDRKQIQFNGISEIQNANNLEIILESVILEIDGIEPNEYKVFVMDFDGFVLSNVNLVMVSEFIEVINDEDLSDLIEVDYNHFRNNYNHKTEKNNDLNISIKTNVPVNKEISEKSISQKLENIQEQN